MEMAELPDQCALGLGMFGDLGLNGFVFSGCWHKKVPLSPFQETQQGIQLFSHLSVQLAAIAKNHQ
jgi:hypothetical protein